MANYARRQCQAVVNAARPVMASVPPWASTCAYYTAVPVAGYVGFPILLNCIGFSAAGPVAGSMAASWQASIGATVQAGSAFAVCQQLAMTGGAAVVGGVVGAAAPVARLGGWLWRR
ncbi:hypothetical protein Dda_7159 [Drechslerella dactyloides]|uniref:Uncharacterized protein n=1 Tax=Drechslerella dactyloides TaxID=74499 RepID=A0AAD6IV87_DREDA|nr:hypothetical protein Dda_7159 [Drechslerella dactyloides]